MSPVNRGEKSSSFAFLGGGGNGHGLGSKGVAHELVQVSICNIESWPIKLYGKEYLLRIESSEDEWCIKDSKYDKNYYVDCVLNLSPESDLYAETGGRIRIEVTDSHETGPVKIRALKRAGHVVLELKMIRDWHIPNETKITSGELKLLRARINGFLRKGSYLKSLVQPYNVRF